MTGWGVIRSIGRTELRVVLALLVVGLLPLLTALWLGNQVVERVSSTAFPPEVGARLEQSLGLYAELVQSMKRRMRAEGALMASDGALRGAVEDDDEEATEAALARLVATRGDVLEASVISPDDAVVAEVRRPAPIAESRERPFTVMQPLSADEAAPVLSVVFAADRTRVDEMGAAQEFVQAYEAMASEHRGKFVDRTYLIVLAILLVTTVVLAVFTGLRVVRPAIRRINQLAAATGPVALGALDVRVPAEGRDEIAELARAFNSMLEQLGQSRARIEFLKRVGEWQNMARRLAHAIHQRVARLPLPAPDV